jgi:hypothetical protein
LASYCISIPVFVGQKVSKSINYSDVEENLSLSKPVIQLSSGQPCTPPFITLINIVHDSSPAFPLKRRNKDYRHSSDLPNKKSVMDAVLIGWGCPQNNEWISKTSASLK